MTTHDLPDRGYRYIPGVSQYSAGVGSLPEHEIVRVRFRAPLPLAEGFAAVERHLAAAGRPLAAFCACELRSPAPFTEDGFRAFNGRYVETLERWGILDDNRNPVARSNVCPAIDPPPEPSFHAFSYAQPSGRNEPTFVIAGSGEVPEGKANYRDHIVRRGDTGPDGMREKIAFVMAAMEARLAALGHGWADTTASQIYTVHGFHAFAGDLVRRGAGHGGMTWHFARPPVVDIDYEMDCRAIFTEMVV